MIDIFHDFYRGKRVLVTGHTGFKGSWLSIWLHELGAEVIGVAQDPFTERDNFVLSGIGQRIKTDIPVPTSETVNVSKKSSGSISPRLCSIWQPSLWYV